MQAKDFKQGERLAAEILSKAQTSKETGQVINSATNRHSLMRFAGCMSEAELCKSLLK